MTLFVCSEQLLSQIFALWYLGMHLFVLVGGE